MENETYTYKKVPNVMIFELNKGILVSKVYNKFPQTLHVGVLQSHVYKLDKK